MENLDEVMESTLKFKLGFNMCAEAHGPVLKAAQLRGTQAKKVVTEATRLNETF